MRYDPYYEHLVLWDPKALRIVGSYRFGHGGRLIAERGMAGLYSSSLFNYSPALESRLAQGLELGRSFIAPGLLALARAGSAVAGHWPVSAAASGAALSCLARSACRCNLPREAREWIAAAHQHYFGVPGLAAARQPFVVSPEVVEGVRLALEGLDASAGLGKLKHHLDALGVSMPVLYRQYVDLVEPHGVQFLDFGEDPGFSGCVDGLVMLDLANLKPAKRARYLGKSA